MTPDLTITVTRSAGADSAVVVFINTTFEPDGSDGGPALRVLINDNPAYEGKAHEPAAESRGVAGEATLEVSLRQIDYEHPHDTGYYEEN